MNGPRPSRLPVLAALALASVPAMPVDMEGQDTRGRFLSRTDPKEIPALVASRELPIIRIFEIGCPSDNEWVASSLGALEEAARTDSGIEDLLAASYGVRILSGDRCPADLPRFDAWLAGLLRALWRDGALGDEAKEATNGPFALLAYIGLSGDPATQALTRDIAMDTTVSERWRSHAARTLVSQRYGEEVMGKDLATDQRYLAARQSVVDDLSSSPRPPLFVVQLREEAERAKDAPRRPPERMFEFPDTCPREPARMLTDDRRLSDLIRSHYPSGLADLGIGGTTHLFLQLDEEGKIWQAKVSKSSGNGSIDRAAMQVARRIRFAPARSCGEPRAWPYELWLRFNPSRRLPPAMFAHIP